MTSNPHVKVYAYSLSLLVPLLVPLGVLLEISWLAPLVMLAGFPLLGLILGQDHSLPLPGMRRSPLRMAYLDSLPRIYVVVWAGTLCWACAFATQRTLPTSVLSALVIGLGGSGALAICTAHELLHRRSTVDTFLARLATALCLYGHMVVEHLHHHAALGSTEYGATARRGMPVYRFAAADLSAAFRRAVTVENRRLRRQHLQWWHNKVFQDYTISLAAAVVFAVVWGPRALVLFVGQALYAVFAFEVITYVHHYGLVRGDKEEAGPHHAWAHHCWLTNCLTFNNTFHADHHLRPSAPYYDLHAMRGSPTLPASYFTMFFVALVPPLWFRLIDPRLDAVEVARRSQAEVLPEWLREAGCR